MNYGIGNDDTPWIYFGKPVEPPTTLSYQLAPKTFATVTTMGNWYSVAADRDRWRTVAEQLAEQLGHIEHAQTAYDNLGGTS